MATTSNATIEIMIVIDTNYVKSNYAKGGTQASPVPIDHKSQFMICTDPRGIISGQGTADLNFKAEPGDYVSVYGTSVTGNSDDAIIVYDFQPVNGQPNLFNLFTVDYKDISGAAQPNPNTVNGLPAVNVAANFSSLNSIVKATGTEFFVVQFALYEMASDGKTQQLYGYYQWDPYMTVS